MDNQESIYSAPAIELSQLVARKQDAYGNSVGRSPEILKILYPVGIRLDQYNDLMMITRTLDKLFRIATDKKAFGEDPWLDIAGYGLLSSVSNQLNSKPIKLEMKIDASGFQKIKDDLDNIVKDARSKKNGRVKTSSGRPKSKKGKPGRCGKYSISREYTTSDQDVLVMRNFFSKWRKEKRFNENQQKALEIIGVKKLTRLSGVERQQILSIFNDVRGDIS